jgi:cellulose biosynthesis protein BcsQ
MALANIAWVLAKRNVKVLVVDWDLEAPGIERYFSSFKIENNPEGLLQLLMALRDGRETSYQNFLSRIDIPEGNQISLLHSGREKDPASYSSLLQSFDWPDFFSSKNGGQHLENLRDAWLNDFDIILIDSRTGLSDSSGICTILMPDILVPMFTANYQSLFGIRDIVKYIQTARQKLEVDRMALTVLPIPSRFGTRVEFKESQEWMERIADILKESYNDWLPKWINPKYILEQIKIPQIDFFSFGEKLAVVEHGTSDPEGMGFIFSKIATLLYNGFSNIETFVGKEYYQKAKKEFEAASIVNKPPEEAEYLYDVYISYPREAYQWMKELLIPALTEYLHDELGREPRLYVDFNEIKPGDLFESSIISAIEKSKTYIYIITESAGTYTESYLNEELSAMFNREILLGKNMIFPVLYSHAGFPHLSEPRQVVRKFNDRNLLNLSRFSDELTLKSTKLRSEFGFEIQKLAKAIAAAIMQKDVAPELNAGLKEENILSENEELLNQLAKEYEDIREQMPAGDGRTRAMEKIVTKMKSAMDNSIGMLSGLTNSKSPGKRLIAIAYLQKFPNADYFNWLAGRAGDAEKPFIGYQATVALYFASRALGPESKKYLVEMLELAGSNIEKSKYKDPNQVSVIKAAFTELKYK